MYFLFTACSIWSRTAVLMVVHMLYVDTCAVHFLRASWTSKALSVFSSVLAGYCGFEAGCFGGWYMLFVPEIFQYSSSEITKPRWPSGSVELGIAIAFSLSASWKAVREM